MTNSTNKKTAEAEKFWIDRDLWEIPILFCNEEDLDFIAIMSRFHYLLLKKDKETYEEFVKYWAILIITAPSCFCKTCDSRNLIFASVLNRAIKRNWPIERIYLPPGQPELVEADNFRFKNWKSLFEQPDSRDGLEDFEVYRWYTNPTITIPARGFFGLLCMNLLGAYTEKPSTFLIHGDIENFNLNLNDAPKHKISFDLGTATYLRDAFRSQADTYRKVVRIILDWSENHLNRDLGSDSLDLVYDSLGLAYFRDKIEHRLIYHGLEIMKYALSCIVDAGRLLKLKAAIAESSSEKMRRSWNSISTIVSHLDGVRSQDEGFLKLQPDLRGEKCKLWPYSRLFSPLYFRSVALEENLLCLAFCVGYSNQDSKKVYDFCCLDSLIYDREIGAETENMFRQRLEQEIERGWNEGNEVYNSQDHDG